MNIWKILYEKCLVRVIFQCFWTLICSRQRNVALLMNNNKKRWNARFGVIKIQYRITKLQYKTIIICL
jgi:hypothetical protein